MSRIDRYRDRREAGRVLAREVAAMKRPDLCVLGLPRGGVPVALEVARECHAPLDVFLVRKLGVPDHPELAMGAIASGDVQVLNDKVIASLGITEAEIAAVAAAERRERDRRESFYRHGRPPLNVAGRSVVLVDDGLATGASMRAAVKALRRLRAAWVMVAVPVGASDTCEAIAREVDALACPLCPEEFFAVGAWYDDFRATTDEEVRACLDVAAEFAETPR